MFYRENSRMSIMFYLCIVCIFVGALSPVLVFPMIGIAALLAVMLGTYYINFPSSDACFGIILLLVFQNFALGLGAHLSGRDNQWLSYLTQIPFMVITIIWFMQIVGDVCKKRFFRKSVFFVMLIATIGISCINGFGDIGAVLVNVRNLTVFYMAYRIGYNCISNEDEQKKFARRLLNLAILVLVVGVFLLITGYDMYRLIGIDEVYIAKGTGNPGGQLDGRFITSIVGREWSRMGSLYYEPVNLAYFYSIALLLAWFGDWTVNRIERGVYTALMLIGLVLSFGKGGWLLTAIVALCVYMYRFFKWLSNYNLFRCVKWIVISLVMCLAVSFCVYYYKKDSSSVAPHFWGVIKTWEIVLDKPLGYGIGTGGNMANVFAGKHGDLYMWLDRGAETAIMSFMYQIGFAGIIALVVCLISLTTKGWRKQDYMYMFIPLFLLGISILQDNTFAPQCIVPFMLFQGVAGRLGSEQETDEKHIKNKVKSGLMCY